MENFQFSLLTYRLEAQIFLGRSHQVFLQLCLCVVVFETCCFTHNPTSHLWLLTKTFFVTPLALHTTPQLHLRSGRPMFAAANFKPSDVQFDIR